MSTLLHILVSALAIIITAYLIPGATVTLVGAIVAAIVLAALNLLIKPILVLLTLPINVLTLGLFTFVINALLILLAASVVPGFGVTGFGTALLFAIVLALVNIVFNRIA